MSKQRQSRCRQRIVPGSHTRKCHYHGGRTPSGIAHPRYNGNAAGSARAAVLPVPLREMYDTARRDPELLSLRSDIAQMEARINQLTGRLDTGESGPRWLALKENYEAFKAAMMSGNDAVMMSSLNAIGETINRAVRDEEIWPDIRRAMKDKADLTGREWRRLVDLQQLITAEQAMAIVTGIMMTVKAHVTDPTALVGIAAGVKLLLARKPDPTPAGATA